MKIGFRKVIIIGMDQKIDIIYMCNKILYSWSIAPSTMHKCQIVQQEYGL